MPSPSDLRAKVAGAFTDTEDDDRAPSQGLFSAAAGRGLLRRIPLETIAPRADQPRQSMDTAALQELVASVRERGVLQPIRVRPVGDGGYQIISGERRWRAARQAGLREILAVVAEADDDTAYVEALVENIQREDLNTVDRARALMHLRVNLGLQSWEEVGRVVGITRQHVHHLLNVIRLPEAVQEDIRAGELTEKHGRALLRLNPYPAQQAALWERIQADKLSGDAALKLARLLRPESPQPPPALPAQPSASTLGGAIDALMSGLLGAGAAAVEAERHRLEELSVQISRALAGTLDPGPDEAPAP